MQDERTQMRSRAITALRALRIDDPGRVITAAEYNALIDAIIEAMATTVDLLRLTILMHMDELRRAQTLSTIERRDNQ